MASEVVTLEWAGTLNGRQSLKVTATGGTVMIQSGAFRAKVVRADIKAANGVIHVIDTVMFPLVR
jgi:uncharacterized surface protein with fasciclin (FAS1) repeats